MKTMYKMQYVFDVTPREVENLTYREALLLKRKRGQKLSMHLWNKKKVAGKIILLSEDEEHRRQQCEKGLRWVDQKIKELNGETMDMKGNKCTTK